MKNQKTLIDRGPVLREAYTGNDDVKQSHSYWLLYNGTEVTIYDGVYGDTKNSTIYKSYPGTSWLSGSQSPDKQGQKDAGPVPEGDYTVNLTPNFDRKVKTNSDGSTKPNVGVEVLPWDNGNLYDG